MPEYISREMAISAIIKRQRDTNDPTYKFALNGAAYEGEKE